MPYRVLAVDDSLLMRKKVEKALRGTEFELVATAGDGEEAVTRFREERPDIVLLDIVMPKQSGKEALRQILALEPGAKVVMISSLATDDAITECLQAGALRFVQKPFVAGDLLDVLRALVQEQ